MAEAEYSWRGVESPVLRGAALRFFAWFANTPLFPLVNRLLAKSSGIPQALGDATLADEEALPMPPDDLAYAERDREMVSRLLAQGGAAGAQLADLTSSATGTDKAAAVRAATETLSACARPASPHAGVWDYEKAYSSGACTPVDVVEHILAFQQRHNSVRSGSLPELSWFVAVDEAQALEAARASAARWEAGAPLSVLDGVPFAVKDNMDARGYETRAGTTFLHEELPPAEDCSAVATLRALGAVLVGKTGLPELAMSGVGVNGASGAPRNPWHLSRLCGGSSSGSAAVVAAGLVPFALGNDAGGSVRIPAAICGCSGALESFHRMRPQGPSPTCAESVGQTGALTTCARDAALLHVVMADAGAPPVVAPPLPAAEGAGGLKGLRVGVFWPWFEDCDASVLGACQAALAALEAAGAETVPVGLPGLEQARAAHAVSVCVEVARGLHEVCSRPGVAAKLAPETTVTLAAARCFTDEEYGKAQRIRVRVRRHFDAAMADVDVMVTPTTACTAPPRAVEDAAYHESDLTLGVSLMKYCQLTNLLGGAGVSVPVGRDADGLPIGLQVIAPAWHEASVLMVAHALELSLRVAGWQKGDCEAGASRVRAACSPLQHATIA